MKKAILSASFAVIFSLPLFATHLSIENVRVVFRPEIKPGPTTVLFDIRWDNAWKNDKNHDAVWVFMKFNGFYNNHVKLAQEGHQVLQSRAGENPDIQIDVSEDSLGFFLYPGQTYRGDIDLKLEIALASNQSINWRKVGNNFQVYGVEMVYIPEGAFTLGSPDTAAVKKAAFYRSDAQGRPDGLITIASETEIQVGPKEGDLYYWSENGFV